MGIRTAHGMHRGAEDDAVVTRDIVYSIIVSVLLFLAYTAIVAHETATRAAVRVAKLCRQDGGFDVEGEHYVCSFAPAPHAPPEEP